MAENKKKTEKQETLSYEALEDRFAPKVAGGMRKLRQDIPVSPLSD